FITLNGEDVNVFELKSFKSSVISNEIGKGKQYIIMGDSEKLRKTITAISYYNFPNTILYSVAYKNISDNSIQIDGWTNNKYNIAPLAEQKGKIFWSYQSGSYDERPDWVLPLNVGFLQKNYMGMNSSDYGGGTPISDVWHSKVGVGVGHVETVPKLVSLPVEMPDSSGAYLGVEYKKGTILESGEILNTFMTFVSIHEGDYYETLETYRKIMTKRGIKFDEPPKTVYEPIWCAWGYQRNFGTDQILNTLPKVAEMGYKWAVLDDGFQTAEGDWYLIDEKFPNGDADMKKFVDTIHGFGMKAKLWWAPMAVDPGTDLIKEHEDYLLLNEDGTTQDITWWDSYYLCPAYKPVQEYTKELVTKIMTTWGYDGLKIDGQHLNGAPPCFNKLHNHLRPEEAVEAVPKLFKVIYETALEINPEAVVEICPCGTAYSFFNLPYMNQPVSSDPESSWQIRHKGKTLKGLMGPKTAYYGDHVELSDGRNDWATTVGIGGVIGTKFTWPADEMLNMSRGRPARKSNVALTAEKEEIWKKWLKIYNENMLPTGNYLGTLYDIGYDKPETHAIEKDGTLYYGFYADEFSGPVELRGLSEAIYKITDYVNNIELGQVEGTNATINIDFNQYLLIKAEPV
ncbi:glycoside hydrolase family 36 protein, partial [Candidatus Neomarinimicrobiota bacterium]